MDTSMLTREDREVTLVSSLLLSAVTDHEGTMVRNFSGLQKRVSTYSSDHTTQLADGIALLRKYQADGKSYTTGDSAVSCEDLTSVRRMVSEVEAAGATGLVDDHSSVSHHGEGRTPKRIISGGSGGSQYTSSQRMSHRPVVSASNGRNNATAGGTTLAFPLTTVAWEDVLTEQKRMKSSSSSSFAGNDTSASHHHTSSHGEGSIIQAAANLLSLLKSSLVHKQQQECAECAEGQNTEDEVGKVEVEAVWVEAAVAQIQSKAIALQSKVQKVDAELTEHEFSVQSPTAAGLTPVLNLHTYGPNHHFANHLVQVAKQFCEFLDAGLEEKTLEDRRRDLAEATKSIDLSTQLASDLEHSAVKQHRDSSYPEKLAAYKEWAAVRAERAAIANVASGSSLVVQMAESSASCRSQCDSITRRNELLSASLLGDSQAMDGFLSQQLKNKVDSAHQAKRENEALFTHLNSNSDEISAKWNLVHKTLDQITKATQRRREILHKVIEVKQNHEDLQAKIDSCQSACTEYQRVVSHVREMLETESTVLKDVSRSTAEVEARCTAITNTHAHIFLPLRVQESVAYHAVFRDYYSIIDQSLDVDHRTLNEVKKQVSSNEKAIQIAKQSRSQPPGYTAVLRDTLSQEQSVVEGRIKDRELLLQEELIICLPIEALLLEEVRRRTGESNVGDAGGATTSLPAAASSPQEELSTPTTAAEVPIPTTTAAVEVTAPASVVLVPEDIRGQLDAIKGIDQVAPVARDHQERAKVVLASNLMELKHSIESLRHEQELRETELSVMDQMEIHNSELLLDPTALGLPPGDRTHSGEGGTTSPSPSSITSRGASPARLKESYATRIRGMVGTPGSSRPESTVVPSPESEEQQQPVAQSGGLRTPTGSPPPDMTE